MSMEVELNRKGGRVCKHALDGEIHCPLIVRPNSEDVVVGNVFGALKHIRPHLWLNRFLNEALGTDRFRQVYFKDLSIRFWERQARFPPHLLPFKEGRTEPDVIIEWENPSTTVWIEAKWLSPLAEGTNGSSDNDQVVRGIRTLLHETGYVRSERLFDIPRRRAIWLSLTMDTSQPLVDRFQGTELQVESMPGAEHLNSLPESPFVGQTNWNSIRQLLTDVGTTATPMESGLLQTTQRYLEHKLQLASRK